MQLLFLDTETSGVNPQTDSIIEIAAIIVELEPASLQMVAVDTFSSLVRFSGEFDNKTTRLTGITQAELELAPGRAEVQEAWHSWLERYTPTAVVGHSIHFDLAFLQVEQWNMPPNLDSVDTLDLAKIAFPQAKAVNLEFIFQFRSLDKLKNRLFPVQNTTNLHRALYDTELCVTLFADILEYISAHQILPSPLFEAVVTRFLKIPVILYNPHTEFKQVTIQPVAQEKTWFETNLPASLDTQLTHLLASVSTDVLFHKLALVAARTENAEMLFLVLNIASCLYRKISSPSHTVYVHLFGTRAFRYVQLLIEYLGESPAQSYQYNLWLEKLVQDLPKLTTTRISFEYLNALIDLAPTLLGEFEVFEQWARLYDFWLFYANQVAHEGAIDVYKNDPAVHSVLERFQQLQNHALIILEALHNRTDPHPLAPKLCEKLTHELKEFSQFQWKNGLLDSIKIHGSDIQISNTVPEQCVAEFISKVQVQSLPIHTHAGSESAQNILHSIGLEKLVPCVDAPHKQVSFVVEGVNNLQDALEQTRTQRCLVLITQNKLLSKIQDIITTHWSPQEYLLYGETGGITKLKSKIFLDYQASVFVRFKDWYHFSHRELLDLFERVVIVGMPYVPVAKNQLTHWGGEWAQRVKQLRTFLIESVAGQVQDISGKSVHYWNV